MKKLAVVKSMVKLQFPLSGAGGMARKKPRISGLLLELLTGIEPVNLILTKDALYRLSYSSALGARGSYKETIGKSTPRRNFTIVARRPLRGYPLPADGS